MTLGTRLGGSTHGHGPEKASAPEKPTAWWADRPPQSQYMRQPQHSTVERTRVWEAEPVLTPRPLLPSRVITLPRGL